MYTQDTVFFGAFAHPLIPAVSRFKDRFVRQSNRSLQMEPFGQAMAKALQDARVDPETGEGIWIKEDHCSPPLAMERAEVLTEYFRDLTVVDKNVRESDGWERIEDSPGLSNRVLDTASNRSRPWVDISRHSDVYQTFEILTIFDSVEPSLRKRFTLRQHVVLLCLKVKKTTTYRDLVDELIGMPRIRDALDLDSIPAPSTLCKAFDRLEIAVWRVLLSVSLADVPLNGITGIDTSGFERVHASTHYTKRTNLTIQQLKTTLLVDTATNAVLDIHVPTT
ncbi:MAG: hypothetical protein J07HQW1_02119 [Haloquadratum walsbyi J07HQW1]|uniref:Uncharacterized protein n=1 Tax=Haloquadratum walsbyi J07HQW1 TaxID=1238424 RepID=U1MQ06_9EURY|nr:MAG: hypothetical protein J07HQW1_02119 [Haloquadratum walsbyi J07HQW1]